MSKDLEKRIIELESIISCQDQMLDDLNSVVIEQNKAIQSLEKDLKALKQTVQIVVDEQNDRPPPHY